MMKDRFNQFTEIVGRDKAKHRDSLTIPIKFYYTHDIVTLMFIGENRQ